MEKYNRKIRNTYNSFLDEKSDLINGIQKYELFIENKYLGVARSLDEYVAGVQNSKRWFIVAATRILILFFNIKCAICLFFNNDFWRKELLDVSYLMGQPILMDTILILTTLSTLLVGGTMTYQEKKRTFYIMEWLYLFKVNNVPFELKRENYRKMAIQLNLLVDYFMKMSYYMVVALLYILFFASHLILFIEYSGQDYLIILLIKSFLLILMEMVCIKQSVLIVCGGVVLGNFCTYYLKLKFDEINAKIELGLKKSDINILMSAIIEHNYVEKLTKQFNNFFRIIIFHLYYVTTIAVGPHERKRKAGQVP